MPHTRSRPKYRPTHIPPYPVYGQEAEDAQLVYKSADLYNYYFERLVNFALSQFEWRGLPETMDDRYLERTLLYNGSAVVFQPAGFDMWLGLGWIQDGGDFGPYGDPRSIKAVDFNGREFEPGVWHMVQIGRAHV